MEIHEFVPYLSVKNAENALCFYEKIFGVSPKLLLKMPDGRIMHCEIVIGNVRIFLSEELLEHGGTPSPVKLGGTSVAIHLYVSNCDAMVDKMVAAGSQLLSAPADMFWGERFARVRDPFGHEWGVTTKIKSMSPSEIIDALSRASRSQKGINHE
ncbi:MAG: VOC family protein [Candidatus Brocadiae bacterium]|nr:VOC family protein [Candidatus Brocadiia bacterium]